MAWGKNNNWKWQLRDSKGRWIEMGRGVKWYSPSLGREVSGTVVGQKGKNAIVDLTSEPNDARTGKPQQVSVKGSDIEVIANKATLNPTADKAISATDEMLKNGQRTAAPKAIVNKAAAPAADVESQLDELEDVTVQADDGALKGLALRRALNDAAFVVPGEQGDYRISAGKDENGEWNFLVSDDKETGIENIAMGVDDTKDVVGKIDKAIKAHEKSNGADDEATPEPEAKAEVPAAPKATEATPVASKYNDAGLTPDEQKAVDFQEKRAKHYEDKGDPAAADRYTSGADKLRKIGEDRIKNGETGNEKGRLAKRMGRAEEPAKPAEAPEKAPEAPKAPEATPEASKPVEDAPEAPKANVTLDELEKQAKADGDTVLYHGGLPEGTTLDGIDLNRNGTQQNKRSFGRSFGGFYLTDESSKEWSDRYAKERGGVMHGFAIDKNARIDDRGKGRIDRLSAEDRTEAAKTADIIKGKDTLGRTQYVILNKDVVKGVGETNIKDDKAPEESKPSEAPRSAEAIANEQRLDAIKDEIRGLPLDDPRQRAYDSAVNNAEDTVREGAVERHSDEYNALILSGYESTLDEIKTEEANTPEEAPEAEEPGKGKPTLYATTTRGHTMHELEYFDSVARESGVDQGYRMDGNKFEVYDMDRALTSLDDALDVWKDKKAAAWQPGEASKATAVIKGLEALVEKLNAEKKDLESPLPEEEAEAPDAPNAEAGTRRTNLSDWKDMLDEVTAETEKPEHEKAGNRLTAAIQKLNGMGGNPTVVRDRAEFDALPGRKVYRGVATQEQADQFMAGPNWVGEGGAGSGIYTSTLKGRGAAFKRANGGALLEMNIPEDARIADGLALEAERKADLERAIAEDDAVGQFLAEGDLGRYATARGYDGFEFEPLADKYDDDEKFVVLTDRSAVSVFGEPAETGTGTDDSAPEESSPSDTNAGTDKSGTAAEGVETPEEAPVDSGLPEFEPVTIPLPREAFKTADKIAKGDRLLTTAHATNGKEMPVSRTDTNIDKGETVDLTGKSATVTGVQKIMGQNKTSQGKVVGSKVDLEYSDGRKETVDLYANRGGTSTKGGVFIDDEKFREALGSKQIGRNESPKPARETTPEVPAQDAAPAPTTPKAPVTAKTPEEILKDAGVTRTEPVALPGEKFAPTRQQQDIIDSVLQGKDTAVQALAGTGKTSTLEALALRLQQQFPDKTIAYVAFNRSVKLEAEGRMPGNVESKTQHGIAYGWADKWMKDRTNDSTSLRRGDEVAGFLGIRETIRPKDGGEPMSVKEQAMAAMKTVDTFALSAEDLPDASHMPEKIKAMGPEVEAAVLASAQKIWEDLNQPDGKMRYSLDHMRKQWALTKPDLSKAGSGLKRKADIIFMDEAQDTPKVMAHLMDQQTAQKVVVGDSNQNIYSSFTGSIDYMSQVKKDVELPLTKSWRFGPEVADIGNRFLQMAGAPTRVEGAGASSKVVSDMQDPDAILVRSNAGMLGEILGELEKGRTVGVPAGTKKDLQSLVASAAFLKGQGDAPPRMHDDLAAYRTWDEVVAEADAGNPTMVKVANMVNTHGIGGLRSILNEIVEKGGDGLEGFVLRKTSDPNVSVADGKTFGNNNADYLKQAGFKFGEIPGAEPMKSGKNKGKPRKGWVARGSADEQREMFQKAKEFASGEAVDVTISTAHKSKGLEWNKVKIGDDFKGPKLNEETGEVDMPSDEELRLGYVAVTRAKGEIDPGSLGYVFDHTDENGGIPKAPETNEPDNAKEDEQPVPTAPDDPEAGSDAEEDAPDARPEDDASREEAERVNSENDEAPVAEEAPAPEEVTPEPEVAPEAPEAPEEAPAPEAPAEEPEDVPEDATETPEGAPVANEEAVPEADREPEPEPEDVVADPETVPEPQELPQKEAPKPTPAPAPVEEEAPAPEEAPTGGTAAPEPNSKPLHPVKAKAGNYPEGTIIRDTQTGEAIQKTNGNWHVAGKPETAANPNDIASPYVYDMPKQDEKSFAEFEGIDSVGPGDILVTRKGTQVAVVGKRDGKLVVAPHNQSAEWRKSRPSLATIPPETVKGVNKFDSAPASSGGQSNGGGTPAERKRTPFSSNRGNSNVTITDVGGNVLKVGDTVRTDMGTGKVVRVRPSDGPSGSAFVEFPDGTIKSFRSNKMRNTASAEQEAAGGDDPAQMEIGTMGEAGDGRAFMVGKGNKPIFKGDDVELADGTTGKVSGFAKGVSSVNIRVEGRKSDIRKKASVVDVPGYNAPESAPQGATPETPAPEATPEPSAPEAPAAPEPEPAVINDPEETPEEREERVAAATSNAKDPAFLSSWWNTVMKDDLNESDIYEISPEMQWKMEEMFGGLLAREESGIQAARGWAIAAWAASKDDKRTPEQQAKMKDLQARITQFVQVQQQGMEAEAVEKARQNKSAVVRIPDAMTPGENMSLKSDRALKPQPALKGAELDAYSGIEAGNWSDDLFGEKSTLNVRSKAGKGLGNTTIVSNSNGDSFRQGTKVYDAKSGEFVGVVISGRRGNGGQYGVNVRKGVADPRRMMSGGNEQVYNVERLISEPAPRVWGKQADLTFAETDTHSDISTKMTEAYPGVTFNFRDDIPIRRTREYAATVSKMLNKYPQLSATLTSVESSPIDPKIKAFAYAATTDHSGLRDTKVVFNAGIGTRIKGAMRKGVEDKYFNNIPEGREMEYVMTHEFGHALDYMTGNLSDNESYELMKELLPPEVLADKRKLGKYLFENGMVSEYSTEGNTVNTVELAAESFADVEINGASAKPISKLVHAELMKRIDEMSGGTGVIPGWTPTQAPAAAPAAV